MLGTALPVFQRIGPNLECCPDRQLEGMAPELGTTFGKMDVSCRLGEISGESGLRAAWLGVL
jgi:hypothetical protein